MNVQNCPRCGGSVRSETVGWMCEQCKGFIDMQGGFHEHTERPFLPPMTNADRIRAMDDEELAEFLSFTWDAVAKAWMRDYDETLYWLQEQEKEETKRIWQTRWENFQWQLQNEDFQNEIL